MASNTKDPQSRKWLFTINNPIDKGFTHDKLKDILAKLKIEYWCMSDEIGEEKTFHTHIFVYRTSPLRSSTLSNKLPNVHRDICNGTCVENRDYVFKQGKWLNTAKGETNLRDTHEEYGEIPIERQGARNDITDLYDMIKEGKSTYEILEECPNYLMHIDKIDKVRQTVREEEFKNTWRELHTEYIWGVTGTGKTRHIMEKYGYTECYRVTDYLHPFDAYKGQDVIIFEEFRSSLHLSDMLNYLDGYPLDLPSRYNNKHACYTKVFIISNIDLRDQYYNVQKFEKTSWDAFLRRIHKVKVFTGKEIVENETKVYLKDYFPIFNSPFDNNDNNDNSDNEKQ